MKRNSFFRKSFDDNKYDKETVEFLLAEIFESENNLEANLENIRHDFPNLTDHSLKHSLALWDYAQLIVDDENYLNPLEAYILHMCFLIHDAGMCFSILNNKEEIETTDFYRDYILLNAHIENVEYEALFYCIRKFHGDYAMSISTKQLASGKMVIRDERLRDEFSHIIGKISKSHSCNISFIENELRVYKSPNYKDFPIDCQKIAFLLRVSDAAHLDNLRTPLPLSKIREDINGISQQHWIFQKKLGFPSCEKGFLVYHSNQDFDVNEQRAWWLCYDALKILDNELKKAEVYFLENQKQGFVARGVKSIENTLDLGNNYIRTVNWKSIDTKIKVSNPKLLTANVGGKNLYGHTFVAIRELLQNSIDAIKLRAIRSEYFVGKIEVILEVIDSEYFLKIKDNGIGMSKNILINQLLDFGSSYWNSYDFYDEYVGIAQQKFKSIGKYGIGFYSVFMLGDFIKVNSIKFGENLNENYSLIFEKGLYENPILKHSPDHKISDYGTEILVKLSQNPYEQGGFIKEFNAQKNLLAELVKYLVPSSPCEIFVKEINCETTIPHNLVSNQKTYSFKEILDIISIPRNDHQNKIIELAKQFPINLQKIKDENNIYGQIAILPAISNISVNESCLVMSNGIRVSSIGSDLVGYLEVDEVTNLNRNEFKSNIPYSAIVDWGLKQLEFINTKPEIDYGEKPKGLKFSLNLLNKDETILAFARDSKNISLISENVFRSLIRNCNEFNYFTLMNQMQNNFNYNGFFSIIRPIGFSGVIKKEEETKIITLDNLIEGILRELWGNFKIDSISGFEEYALSGFSSLNYPFMEKKTYTKL